MAAFCGRCGKPIAADGRFCGACGSPSSATAASASLAPTQVAPAPVAAITAAPGSSTVKIILVILVLGGGILLAAGAGAFFLGRKKLAEWQGSGAGAKVLAAAERHSSRSHSGDASEMLSKEEVGEIIGRPVTDIEMTGKSDATYKTATMGFETAIEVEHEDGVSGATQSLEAARVVTKRMAGGKGESVAGLGDDALYGAFNVLYVRRNDILLTITPPNLKQAAQMEQTNNLLAQPMGSEAQVKAIEKLRDGMKGDPVSASLSKPDAMSGAVDLIHHSGVETGDEYETKSRLMARHLAEKMLSKIGS
jgi:hypothetical protein